MSIRPPLGPLMDTGGLIGKAKQNKTKWQQQQDD